MKKVEYKGKKAYLIENENIRILVVPELGGKLVSACLKNPEFEFLYQNDRDIVTNQGFAVGEACGCDDAFPNIDEETLSLYGKEIRYPDHGEIWSTPMVVEHDENDDEDKLNEIELSCVSKILPYHYYKKITLMEDGLQIQYKIRNTGTESFPCLWVLHDLVRYEEDMELIYPKGTESFLNVFENQELGSVGTMYTYDECDSDNKWNKVTWGCGMRKYYVSHPVKEGNCGYLYPSQKVCCMLEYDSEILPFLGIWITEGGFRGDYNLAMEPATGFYDSVGKALENNSCTLLEPGEKLEFSIRFRLQRCT